MSDSREQLAAREITIQYGSDAPPVLSGLTLGLRAGELVGVVGPNGAGKSTLVRALSRALRPARGVVLLHEHDLYGSVSARESAREVGVVPQDTTVAFDFSVREVVEMGRSPRLPRRPFAALTTADAQAVEAALQRAEIVPLAARAVTTLSGGERQRTLLARALAQETEVLLLDEPTAHLDLHHQMQTLALVRDLAHGQGKAVLAVLHDLNLAAAFCDKIILLHNGRIAAQGPPSEVLTAERVRQVYGARVWARVHPVTGRPYLLPLPEGAAEMSPEMMSRAVHVLCGGGTGAGLLFALAQRGLTVTVGGLNAGDLDAEAATALGVTFPLEAPFSPLSESVVAEMRRLAGQSEAVLLAEASFGPMNLAVLETVLAARLTGKPVICVQSPGTPFAARDYTGGAATRLWARLTEAGAVIMGDADAAVGRISVLLQ